MISTNHLTHHEPGGGVDRRYKGTNHVHYILLWKINICANEAGLLPELVVGPYKIHVKLMVRNTFVRFKCAFKFVNLTNRTSMFGFEVVLFKFQISVTIASNLVNIYMHKYHILSLHHESQRWSLDYSKS